MARSYHLHLLYLLAVVGMLSSFAEAFRFDLPPGRTKCITEDMTTNSLTVGKYYVVPSNPDLPLPDNHRMNVRVRITHAHKINHNYISYVCVKKHS